MAPQTLPVPAQVSAAGPWYVATSGSDTNDCLSPTSPCGTINGAAAKAVAGDTLLVATGTYTGSGGSVVVLIKDLTLSGGWDETFTSQTGRSVIDGENARNGISVPYGDTDINLSRFVVQHASTGGSGGGISVVHGSMLIENSLIVDNYATAGGGGISVLSYSTVTIRDSAIVGNTSPQWGGGVYSDYSTLVIVNSTISGNHTDSGGGGIVKSGDVGSLKIYSSTISMNSANSNGGGILGAFTIVLRNTILAGNSAQLLGPDCYLPAASEFTGGYNLVGNTSGCDFIPTTGDLTNIDPKLGGLQDNGGATLTHALLTGSLAIDHSDLVGCRDQLGNPLVKDQRGEARQGWCDIGAYEWQPPPPGAFQVYLPCINKTCSPSYYDNFSNPASGWSIADSPEVRYEYLNGEYRILVKRNYLSAVTRTGFTMSDYVVEVDARNDSMVNGSYGLIFGASNDWSQFYVFEIDTDWHYAILRADGSSGWWVLAEGSSLSIEPGIGINKLKIERKGSQIWAYSNGHLLNILTDGTFTGARYAGLIASTFSQPNVDARFDNFTVYPISCGASSAIQGGMEDAAAAVWVESGSVENWQNRPHQRGGLK